LIARRINGDDFCTLDSCSDSLSYLKHLEWDTNQSRDDIFHWLKSRLKKGVVTFCKETPSTDSTEVTNLSPRRIGKTGLIATYAIFLYLIIVLKFSKNLNVPMEKPMPTSKAR